MARRLVVAVLMGALVSAALVAAAAPSGATVATIGGVAGQIESAAQARDGSVTVTGWAFRPAHSARRMYVCIWSDHRCRKVVRTLVYRHKINEQHHIVGDHGFQTTLPRGVAVDQVTLRAYEQDAPAVSARDILTPGQRVVNWARLFVHKSPYRSGGASPAGFDCSGYVLYVYAHARVQSLPHQTNAQRAAPYMHKIWRYQARPGDLVFYLSGRTTYHVAIYAGGGMQYAATVPGERIQYQRVWSAAVEYRTDWH